MCKLHKFFMTVVIAFADGLNRISVFVRQQVHGWLRIIGAAVCVVALSSSNASAALIGVLENLLLQGDSLATLNPASAAVSPLGSAGFPVGYYAPVYDPANNTVYLTGFPISNTSTNLVRSFNATTGAEADILFQTPPGVTITGLAVDPLTGTLFGVLENLLLQGDSLAILDPANAAVSPLGSASFPVGYYAPVYDPANNTVDLTGFPISNTSTNLVRSFNATTGAEADIFFQTAPGVTITGLAAVNTQSRSVPEPSTLALLALSLTGLAIGKRRRKLKRDMDHCPREP